MAPSTDGRTQAPLIQHPSGPKCWHTDTHKTPLCTRVLRLLTAAPGTLLCALQAKVLNPLLPMDFHNDVRVHVVPETEEFIKMIGHMATEEDIQYMQVGVGREGVGAVAVCKGTSTARVGGCICAMRSCNCVLMIKHLVTV